MGVRDFIPLAACLTDRGLQNKADHGHFVPKEDIDAVAHLVDISYPDPGRIQKVDPLRGFLYSTL